MEDIMETDDRFQIARRHDLHLFSARIACHECPQIRNTDGKDRS